MRLEATINQSMNGPRFARHVVHQQVLAESVRGREVGLSAAHLRDFLNKLNQPVVDASMNVLIRMPARLHFGLLREFR